MTERIPAPTEIADTNWNDDGVTYPSTDPGGAKRLTGFKPDNVPPASGDGEIVTANDQNWLHGLTMLMLTWIKSFIPREWTELSEGIAAANLIASRTLFRVVSPSSGIRSRLVTMWTTTSVATGTGDPKAISNDGEQAYYVAGTGNRYVVAVSPVDGSLIWEINPHGAADVTALTADGRYVYYVLSATVTGLQRVDRDGTNLTVAGVTLNHNKLRANGGWVAGISGSTGAGDADIWRLSDMTLVATKATGSAGLTGLAIDEDNIYVGGVRNTSDVWAYTTVSGGAVWAVQLDANALTINDMCSDGDFVYVATNTAAIAAGGNRALFCLDRVSGLVLWSMDIGVSVTHCAVDDEYIYALDNAANNLYMIRKGQTGQAGIPGVVKVKGSVAVAANDVLTVDGVSIYGRPSGAATDLIRISNGGISKTFMLAAGIDIRRRPFYTLALPVGSRI